MTKGVQLTKFKFPQPHTTQANYETENELDES